MMMVPLSQISQKWPQAPMQKLLAIKLRVWAGVTQRFKAIGKLKTAPGAHHSGLNVLNPHSITVGSV